jgi:hypothetical protein
MYELLKQYESIGSRRVSVQYLKDFLSIESSKFTKYNDFKRFVILVTQKELEDKTDIYFSFSEIKQGRKIVEIIFTIYSKNTVIQNSKKNNSLESKEEYTLNPVYDLVKKLIPNIADSQLKKILTTYDMAQVFNAVAIVEKYKTKDSNADLAGLFVSALKQGWNNQSPAQPSKQQSSPVTPTQMPQTDVTPTPRVDNSAALVTFYELPEQEQQQIIHEFLQSPHVNEFIVDKWDSCKKHRENPLEKPLIKGVFIQFLLEK